MNLHERVTAERAGTREVTLIRDPHLYDGRLCGRVVDESGWERHRPFAIPTEYVVERQMMRWNADGLLVPTDREPAACGECADPETMGWDYTLWVNDAPVIACEKHRSLAPGWVYETDEIRRVLP